jgi:nitrogen-specific signal transduction histidine kinase/ActR/RegA family two-component response regulator
MVEQAEQLRRSRRLETIGQLVGGVAHDFNNLLAVIEGNLDFLLQDEEVRELPTTERYEMLASALSAARRGADLTTSLLAFARRSRLEPSFVDINEVVRETERWLGRAIPASITRQSQLWSEPVVARLDRTRLQSALVNIIVNARDAMPEGGRLTIQTTRVEMESGNVDATGRPIPPGPYLVLAVADTGTGIPAELLPRVFEPFVTTKEVGKGTGLGLSMVLGFVTQTGGFLGLESVEGQGTTVKLAFPEPEAPAPEESSTSGDESGVVDAAPSARILVAEDELGVLNVVVRTLSRAGYSVEAATNGEEALDVFAEHPHTFDLLLTDVVMPGPLSGPDLADACRDISPTLKVLFMSGYMGEVVQQSGRIGPDDVLLTKPVPRLELLEAVREALESDRDERGRVSS